MNIRQLIAKAAAALEEPPAMKWVPLTGEFAGNEVYISPAYNRQLKDWTRREAWAREIPVNALGQPEPDQNRALMMEANARHILRDWKGPLFEDDGKRIAYTPELGIAAFQASDALYMAVMEAAVAYELSLRTADEAAEKNS